MQSFWNRIKTEPSATYHPNNQCFNLSQRNGNKFDPAKHSLQATRTLTSRHNLKLTPKEQNIRQENIRLISKLMEIGTRKSKVHSQEPLSLPKRRENTEKERLITLENQRLGRSLVRIKSGKGVDRVKTDIARSLAKLNRQKKQALSSSRNPTMPNDPETQSSCRNISELSKGENLPKKLTRARVMGAAELLQFKKCFV